MTSIDSRDSPEDEAAEMCEVVYVRKETDGKRDDDDDEQANQVAHWILRKLSYTHASGRELKQCKHRTNTPRLEELNKKCPEHAEDRTRGAGGDLVRLENGCDGHTTDAADDEYATGPPPPGHLRGQSV